MKSLPIIRGDNRSQSSPAMWCLRLVVVIQCLGLSGRYLLSSGETESDIYGWLYFDLRWPESLSQAVDDTGMAITLASAAVLCVAGICRLVCNQCSMGARMVGWFDQVALGWIAVWAFALSIAHMLRVAVYGELALAEHAVRYAGPIALILLCRAERKIESERATESESVSEQTRSEQLKSEQTQSAHRSRRLAVSVLVIAAAATISTTKSTNNTKRNKRQSSELADYQMRPCHV